MEMPSEAEVLSVIIKSKAELYAAYMPFIKHGGLFVTSQHDFRLGDEVFIILQLLNVAEKHSIAGKVIWITPRGAQGGLHAVIGVQLKGEVGQKVRDTIETHLDGMLTGEMRTETM